jgi:DNA-directed RNA polymerase subunit RPC12/RpoP
MEGLLMADIVSARCGLCGKGFKLRPEQLGREVRCPHCKTVVVIEKRTEAAREAIEALGDTTPVRRPVTTRRQVRLPRGGVRNKGLAVAWIAVLGVALLVVIVLAVTVASREDAPPEEESAGQGVAAPPPSPEPRRIVYSPPGERSQPESYEAPGEPVAEPGERPSPEPSPQPPAQPPPARGIQIRAQASLAGRQGGAATCRCGMVSNTGSERVSGLLITSRAHDVDRNAIGTATYLIRHLEPGAEVPFVAVLPHGPGVKVDYWTDDYAVEPGRLALPEARLVVDGAVWYNPDRGEFSRTGEIIVPVRNPSSLTIRLIEVSAILYRSDGSVLSVVTEQVEETLPPRSGPTDVRVRYEGAVRTLIDEVVADAQAVMRR